MQDDYGSQNAQANGMTIALLYARTYMGDEARDGSSLPAQLADTRLYAGKAGWALGGEYQDVLSGKRESCPGYQSLLAELGRRRSEEQDVAVVVDRLDRFGPSALERARAIEELSKLGASIHSVVEGGLVPELMANVLAAVAKDEVRQVSQRVSEARRDIAAGGWYLPGVAPWGYRWREATPEERAAGAPKKVIEEDPLTAPYAREAYRRAAEGETIHGVARWVQTLPEDARGGRRMTYQAVRFILRCPTYISRAWPKPYDGKRSQMSGPLPTEPGRWPPLVDEASWHRVQDLVHRHKRIPRQASGRHLLTGFLRCPSCGSPMVGIDRSKNEAERRTPAVYQCRGVHYLGAAAPDPTCRFRVAKSSLDAALLSRVSAILDVATTIDPRIRAGFWTSWRRLAEAQSPTAVTVQIAQLEREAERYRYRLTEGARLLVDGVLDRGGYDRLRDAQEGMLKAAEAEIERLKGALPENALPPLDEVLAAAGEWAEAVRGVDVPSQREVLALLVERVLPVREDGDRYHVAITWTPLGTALAGLAD